MVTKTVRAMTIYQPPLIAIYIVVTRAMPTTTCSNLGILKSVILLLGFTHRQNVQTRRIFPQVPLHFFDKEREKGSAGIEEKELKCPLSHLYQSPGTRTVPDQGARPGD